MTTDNDKQAYIEQHLNEYWKQIDTSYFQPENLDPVNVADFLNNTRQSASFSPEQLNLTKANGGVVLSKSKQYKNQILQQPATNKAAKCQLKTKVAYTPSTALSLESQSTSTVQLNQPSKIQQIDWHNWGVSSTTPKLSLPQIIYKIKQLAPKHSGQSQTNLKSSAAVHHTYHDDQPSETLLGYDLFAIDSRNTTKANNKQSISSLQNNLPAIYTPDLNLNDLLEQYESELSHQDLVNHKLVSKIATRSGEVLSHPLQQAQAIKYLQRTILHMEMEQIAESIVGITKRIALRRITNAPTQSELKIIKQEATANRPLLINYVKASMKTDQFQCVKVRQNKQDNDNSGQGVQQQQQDEKDKWFYLVQFDKSMDLASAWIDNDTLRLFNSLRSNIYVSSSMFDEIHLRAQQNTFAKKEPQRLQPPRQGRADLLRPQNIPKKVGEVVHHITHPISNISGQKTKDQNKQQIPQNLGFCHHCKLVKRVELLADCNYDSKQMGVQIPQSQEVGGVLTYNLDVNNSASVRYIATQAPKTDHQNQFLKRLQLQYQQSGGSAINNNEQLFQQNKSTSLTDSVNQTSSTSLNINNNNNSNSNSLFSQHPYKCHRSFCSYCLQTQYEEQNFAGVQTSRSWLCPCCLGVCNCTHCIRQDMLTQLRAFLFSLSGTLLIDDAYEQMDRQKINGANSEQEQAGSAFDKFICENYKTHLALTQITNPTFNFYNKSMQYKPVEKIITKSKTSKQEIITSETTNNSFKQTEKEKQKQQKQQYLLKQIDSFLVLELEEFKKMKRRTKDSCMRVGKAQAREMVYAQQRQKQLQKQIANQKKKRNSTDLKKRHIKLHLKQHVQNASINRRKNYKQK